MSTLRALTHLESVSRDYPGIWKHYGAMLAKRGNGLPEWPTWCYCPLAGAHAIATQTERPKDVARVGALAAWRPTQGVYRFDPDLLKLLFETPVSGVLPVDHLRRLPAWCVYVETPGYGVDGFFAHLEWDANDGRTELRLLLDDSGRLVPVAIHLGSDIGGGIEAFMAAAEVAGGAAVARLTKFVTPFVSVLLYLCSGDADAVPTRGQRKPVRHLRAKLTKGGEHIVEGADKPEVYNTGFDLARRLREARERSDGGEGRSVRGHVRRAHWHSFWVGSGEQRRLELRWLHPILVGLGPNKPTVVSVR